MKTPRIALFALTGFGNPVLSALCANDLKPNLLVTRMESGPFPYYDEVPLIELAAELGVPCEMDVEGEQRVLADPPDVLLCATYHRMLRAPMLKAVAWAINLHPSLLPRYRGPNPFYWVIHNGETSTGVTAHVMTGDADAGPIVWSESIAISLDETQGSLRQRLAALAAKAALVVLRDIQDRKIVPIAQDEGQATSFGHPQESDRTFDTNLTVEQAGRLIRAFAPFPGVAIGQRIACGVLTHEPASRASPGTVSAEDNRTCQLQVADGDIVVQLSPLKPA